MQFGLWLRTARGVLDAIEFGVDSTFREQLGMGAYLGDFAFIEQ